MSGAIAQIQESMRLNPALWRTHYALAVLLRASGKPDGAKTQFAEAQRLRP